MKRLKISAALMTALCMVLSLMPVTWAAESDGEVHVITLSSAQNGDGSCSHAAYDGTEVREYDYTWHVDPSEDHGEVKNAPAEYYTGTKPSGDEAVYIAHDIFYYPQLPQEGFKLVNYDGEQEWAYYYTAEGLENWIFATLPTGLGMGRVGNGSTSSIPTQMMHTAEEAYENAVLHITQAGTYVLEGTWHGQIWIDLGDSAFTDESAKVTVILNGVDVTCTVAPALVFYSVYECDNTWETRSVYSATADTSDAGANVILADGTVNNFTGTNVYRMLKTTYKKDGVTQKKQRKTDAAFYSYMSMNITGGEEGTGVLNVTSGFEGLDAELHLTFNGGNVNIFSQDDGINVNEDGVSVVTFNGGNVHILAGLGSEGDGVDSNGFLVINGGTVISMANPASDAGLDSDSGSYVNGGTVVALGSTMDWAGSDESSGSGQAVMNLQFSSYQNSDEAIILTDLSGKVVFAYDPDKDEVAGSRARQYRGAIVASPALVQGESYHLYVGGDVTGTETAGVYDADTVTGFTQEAKQQCWNGTWEQTAGRGGMMGGQRFEGMELPEGFDPSQLDRENHQGKDRFDWSGQLPGDSQVPGGTAPQEPPQGFDGRFAGGKGGLFGGETQAAGTGSVEFALTKATNSFSGVTDYDGTSANSGGATGFVDVAPGAWYESAVRYVYERGLMTGTSDIGFSPTADTTRGMIVSILYRLEGSPVVSGSNRFSDVAAGQYYADAVAWASTNGIVTGYNDGFFGPNDTLTREQLAVILYRYALYKGYDVAGGAELSGYTDRDRIGSYALEAMTWANARGLIGGTDATTLYPNGSAARAQVAEILMRFCENIVEK